MVNLMDVLVEEGRYMHSTVGPVMPCVFQDEKDCNLVGHLEDGREWNGGTETTILGHWVEEPNLRKLDCEVT